MRDLEVKIVGSFIEEFKEFEELTIHNLYSKGMVGCIMSKYGIGKCRIPIDKIDYLYNSSTDLFSIKLDVKDIYLSLNEDELKKALYLAYTIENNVKELVKDFIMSCDYYERIMRIYDCNDEMESMLNEIFNVKSYDVLNMYMRNVMINKLDKINYNITQLACLDDETFNALVGKLKKHEMDGVNKYIRFGHPKISDIRYYKSNSGDKGIFNIVKEEYELLVELSKKFRDNVA